MVPAAGIAEDQSTVPGWNLSFTLALGAYLHGFRVDDGASTRGMILHVIFNQPLAFFSGLGFSKRPGDLLRFFVLKFNDKLPFGNDSSLNHASHIVWLSIIKHKILCL